MADGAHRPVRHFLLFIFPRADGASAQSARNIFPSPGCADGASAQSATRTKAPPHSVFPFFFAATQICRATQQRYPTTHGLATTERALCWGLWLPLERDQLTDLTIWLVFGQPGHGWWWDGGPRVASVGERRCCASAFFSFSAVRRSLVLFPLRGDAYGPGVCQRSS